MQVYSRVVVIPLGGGSRILVPTRSPIHSVTSPIMRWLLWTQRWALTDQSLMQMVKAKAVMAFE